MMLRCPYPGDGLLEMVAAQVPDARRVELLRSTDHPSLEQGGDPHQRGFGLAEMRVHSGERDRRLPGVLRFSAYRGHQPRSAGDRFAPSLRIRQTHKQAPPVVDERHGAGRELAAMQVVGCRRGWECAGFWGLARDDPEIVHRVFRARILRWEFDLRVSRNVV